MKSTNESRWLDLKKEGTRILVTVMAVGVVWPVALCRLQLPADYEFEEYKNVTFEVKVLFSLAG